MVKAAVGRHRHQAWVAEAVVPKMMAKAVVEEDQMRRASEGEAAVAAWTKQAWVAVEAVEVRLLLAGQEPPSYWEVEEEVHCCGPAEEVVEGEQKPVWSVSMLPSVVKEEV
jgi:hypothetical protein